MVLALTACGLRVFPGDRNITQPELNYPRRVEELRFVSVEFNAKLDLAAQEGLAFDLEILDDLSDLPQDSQRVPMSSVGDGVYTAAVNIPLGANVFYRYVRTAPGSANEADALGNEIRFRAGYVHTGASFNDHILAWSDQAYAGTFGILRGQVTDAAANAPLADIVISVAGMQAISDATGRFFFDNLPVGSHNLAAFSLDGSHQSFQQEVVVEEGGVGTAAIFSMNALPEVTLTFVVKVPDDAAGAPLRLAGNMSQLGRVFDSNGDLRALASRMPKLEKRNDGRYELAVKLHAGNDLRYKYTLGDAALNTERDANGTGTVRRFIVPNRDLTLRDEVLTWRVSEIEPAILQVKAPDNTPASDTVWLQFAHDGRSSLVPMWTTADNTWLYLVYGSAEEQATYTYTICRNSECNAAYDPGSKANPIAVSPGNPAANLTNIAQWRAWAPVVDPRYSNQDIQMLKTERLSGVEWLPDHRSDWYPAYAEALTTVSNMGFNWLILRPAWQVSIENGNPVMRAEPGRSMLTTELGQLISTAKELGFKVALYPSLDYGQPTWDWWNTQARSLPWWEKWFIAYDKFLLHFLQIANQTEADQFIIGGPELRPVYPGAIAQGDEGGDTPPDVDERWQSIIEMARQHFGGQILWAEGLGSGAVPAFDFMQSADAYYLSLPWHADPPENWGVENMTQQLDGPVWEFSQAMAKPLFIGLQAASADYGLYSEFEPLSPLSGSLADEQANLEGQRFYYDLYTNGLLQRAWIAGVASQGYFPVVKLTDYSSSIYGKPAMDILWYQNILQAAQ